MVDAVMIDVIVNVGMRVVRGDNGSGSESGSGPSSVFILNGVFVS